MIDMFDIFLCNTYFGERGLQSTRFFYKPFCHVSHFSLDYVYLALNWESHVT
jgi:hypothetical protein